jgi:hypothetical protein
MDDICLTRMTSFPLQCVPAVLDPTLEFVAPARAGPPVETKSAQQPRRRMHPSEQHRSNSLAPTAGDRLCRETKPCPRPSSDGRSPPRTPARTTDGKGGLCGNVDLHCCHVAHLKTHANAFAERWVRSVKEECLSRLILFGEGSLKRALTEYVERFHRERPHQGKGNVLLFPAQDLQQATDARIACK